MEQLKQNAVKKLSELLEKDFFNGPNYDGEEEDFYAAVEALTKYAKRNDKEGEK